MARATPAPLGRNAFLAVHGLLSSIQQANDRQGDLCSAQLSQPPDDLSSSIRPTASGTHFASFGSHELIEAVLMKILRQWLASLNEADRSLRSQGYLVVYGGMTSFVAPFGSSGEPPRQRGRPIGLRGAAPAALGL
jgi:hypothetical protein